MAVGINTSHELDVDSWTDIIQVATSYVYTVGLKSDGTVVAAGDCFGGACDVDTWNLIVTPDAMSWMLLLLFDM